MNIFQALTRIKGEVTINYFGGMVMREYKFRINAEEQTTTLKIPKDDNIDNPLLLMKDLMVINETVLKFLIEDLPTKVDGVIDIFYAMKNSLYMAGGMINDEVEKYLNKKFTEEQLKELQKVSTKDDMADSVKRMLDINKDDPNNTEGDQR